MKMASLLLVQLLPLVVFIVVDSFVTDVRISIACAVLFAVGQMIFTYVKTRRFEWLILVDVGLIVALGGISIAFDNEIFFKVKPAIMEGVAVLLFVGLILAPPALLIRYFGRMMPGTTLKDEAAGMMKPMLGVICACTAVHAGAVVYTAFYSSKEVWAFVSGPGFYLLILPVAAVAGFVQRARRRRSSSSSDEHPQAAGEPKPSRPSGRRSRR